VKVSKKMVVAKAVEMPKATGNAKASREHVCRMVEAGLDFMV
jgi:hypothetical protein